MSCRLAGGAIGAGAGTLLWPGVGTGDPPPKTPLPAAHAPRESCPSTLLTAVCPPQVWGCWLGRACACCWLRYRPGTRLADSGRWVAGGGGMHFWIEGAAGGGRGGVLGVHFLIEVRERS